MYLYGATKSSSADTIANLRSNAATSSLHIPHNHKNDNFLSRTIGKEVKTLTLSRAKFKDTTSAKLRLKGPKMADAVLKSELRYLHSQTDAFEDTMKEELRKNYLLEKNNKMKDLQEFQCLMMGKFEEIISEEMRKQGIPKAKFKIGGFDGGTYEKFFKTEPAKYMSKAQFTTAVRLIFGSHIIKSDKEVSMLYDSFDARLVNKMDWRSFLYLFTIMMQPKYAFLKNLRYGFAIYSSTGSLDMDCEEPLALGMIKKMICTPIILSMWPEVMTKFTKSWDELSTSDTQAMEYAARLKTVKDPDDVKIPYELFNKIISNTRSDFYIYLKKASVFGKRDSREWTCLLEEQTYHPIILKRIKVLRREARNDAEADKFIARTNYRIKLQAYKNWQRYVERRNKLRLTLIAAEIRSMILNSGYCFDLWKRYTIRTLSAVLLQRYIRGFIGRRRNKFVKRMTIRVSKLQANTRRFIQAQKFRKKWYRLFWAAVGVQRLVRGWLARRKIAQRLEAYIDTQHRLLEKEKAAWHFERMVKSAMSMQAMVRRFLRRRRMMKVMQLNHRVEFAKTAMEKMQNKHRVNTSVYRKSIMDFYVKRKEEYDKNTLDERQTLEQRRLIAARRNEIIKNQKEREREAREKKLEQIEEERIDRWIQRWEIKIEERATTKKVKCENAILLPETPEDLILKKKLLSKIKGHVKNVLRKADKMKIPMEIPEAKEKAQVEIIQMEVEAEIAAARKEMRKEAEIEQALVEQKKKDVIKQERVAKKRRSKRAVVTIQNVARIYLARKVLRRKAYARYVKHFDQEAHEYFYEDKVANKTFWKKPPSLGNYDIIMDENKWVVVKDKTGQHTYYYNPGTWLMSWDIPGGTIMCDICAEHFAVARLVSLRHCKAF